MKQEELRKHRCCFTGHRPNKLDYSESEIKLLLEKAIDNAISDGYVTFITGMAEGVDIWAAEIVLKKIIKIYTCFVPYRIRALKKDAVSMKQKSMKI